MSDPSVQAMTYEQWLFEYHALKKYEETWLAVVSEGLKALVCGIRDVLIGVLGLNYIRRAKAVTPTASATSNDVPDFIPAAFLFSRPEALKAYMQEAEREEAADAALKDDAFEKLSQALMRGDMVPIPSSKPDADRLTAALGIKVGDPDHDVPLIVMPMRKTRHLVPAASTAIPAAATTDVVPSDAPPLTLTDMTGVDHG